MQSFSKHRFYALRADASAVGGYLDEVIPTLAPVSLSAVGGFSMARSEAFTLDEIVSCSSAYTRVSGRAHAADGSSSILVTAVVEGLNILEVVLAERVVAQVSITIRPERGPPLISLAGSGFQGLRLAAHDCRARLNPDLQQTQGDQGGPGQALTLGDIHRAASAQAEKLLACFKNAQDEDGYQWALNRHGWMSSDSHPAGRHNALCSLVDGLEVAGPIRCCGHIVQIPEFGRIILGELLVERDSVQLLAIRAELGCAVAGQVGAACVGGGGTGDN
jgi:hypothetical protein